MSIFIALQNSILGNNNEQIYTVAIQKCGNFPYEIALRFAGCNLQCGACFASGYSWPQKYQLSKRVRKDIAIDKLIEDYDKIPKNTKPYNWMRILGGEPLLNDTYIRYLFSFIEKIAQKDTEQFNNGIIIQTNGIWIGNHDITLLENCLNRIYELNPNLRIAIEISIKGTNPSEFSLLTRSSNQFYNANINAYYKLRRILTGNLRATIIAGFGISESLLLSNGQSPKSIMTIISNENSPTFHPDNWSIEFTNLYNQFTNDWKNKNPIFNKMPMYGIKDEFNYNWVQYALKQAKEIYKENFYDPKYTDRNQIIENKILEMLNQFTLVSNQNYYSELIS